ncbi:MAG: DUF5115 domain-containing protein [Bacteroidales bacterium]|nr:DUF5115 domain-containing protein [Bacteroidales bacterium]
MKKTYLYLTLFLVGLFVSCADDVGLDVTPPQSYPQETAQTVDGFAFTLSDAVKSPIVLSEEDLTTAKTFEAILATATPTLAEGASVTYQLEVSDTEEFTNFIPLSSASQENIASVNATDLNEAAKALYGKAPNARELYVRVTYYITEGTSSVMMPNPVILGPVTVTPVAPIIETEYYIVGNLNDWDIKNLDAFKFNHSGKDVYDDPIFTILVKTMLDADGNGYFKIVPKSSKDAAEWDGVIGNPTDGNTETTGELLVGGDAMRVTEPGWVKLTLNMMEYTYTIEVIGEMNLTLYVPGGHQGWAPDAAPTLYNRNFDFKYDGFAYFANAGNEFKFTSQPDWGGINYGNGGEGILSTDGGAGNLTATDAGYYQLTADLSGSPYTYTAIKTDWGLIGDATINSWDKSTPMTYDPTTNVWTVTTTLSVGEFKFRANDGWDINLGGDMMNLTYGGDNIKVTEAGTYIVTLDLSNAEAYKCTMVKQ